MSARLVMVWVAVAGALAGVYLFLSAASVGSTASETETVALGVDPAGVVRMRFDAGGPVVVERDAESVSGWTIGWGSGDAVRRWAAREQAVRGFVRALASAEVEPRGDVDAGAGPALGSVEIEVSDGRGVRLSIGSGGVGGRLPATLDDGGTSRGVWIGREVGALFDRASLLAWRDLGVMSGTDRASGLAIEGGGEGVTLTRARGRWAVTAPVDARGDESRAEDTLARLRGLRLESFVDGDGDGVTGLGSPVARMVIESERREAVGDSFERVVTRRVLEIGAEADAGATTRFVRSSARVVREGETERVFGPVVGVMSVEGLGGVTALAEAYISRVPVGVPAGDVGAVGVAGVDGTERARFSRDRRGWRRVTGEAEVPATEAEAAGVEALLAMLCTDGMDRVEALGGESSIGDAIGTVRLETGGGGVIATLEFGGAEGSPVVRDGGVFWIGAGERGPGVLAWVRGVLGQ